jgi:hypothetical protein
LYAELSGRGVQRLGGFEIGHRARHDLGETRLAPAGALSVRCSGSGPLWRARLEDQEEQRFELRPAAPHELVRGELCAGRYQLVVETAAGVLERSVEVRAGETTRVELAW